MADLVAGQVAVEIVAHDAQFQAALDRSEARARASGDRIGRGLSGGAQSGIDRISQQLAQTNLVLERVAKASEAATAAISAGFSSVGTQAAAAAQQVNALTAALQRNASAPRPQAPAPQPAPRGGQFRVGPANNFPPTPANSNSFAGRTGLHGSQVTNLGYQANDIIGGLLQGQSPVMIAAQQGGQVLQILQSSSKGVIGAAMEVGGAIGRYIINPYAAAAVAIATATAATLTHINAQDRLARALEGTGRASGMTLAGINNVAQAGASAGNLSLSAARDLAAGYAQAGVGGATAQGAIGLTRRFANFTGQGIGEAGGALAGALGDPSKGIGLLEQNFGKLNQTVVENIRRLDAQGDRLGAQAALFAALESAMKETTDQTWSLSKAFTASVNAVSNFGGKIGEVIARAVNGASLEDRRTELQAMLAAANAPAATPAAARRRTIQGNDPRGIARDLDDVQDQIDRKARIAAQAATTLQNNANSQAAEQFIKDALPDEARMKGLADAATLLGKVDTDRAREALKRFQEQIDNFKGAADRIRQDSDANVAATLARTDAEKASIKAQLEFNKAMQDGLGPIVAAARAEQERNRYLADTQKALRDLTQTNVVDAAKINATPAQRQDIERRERQRQERERLGGDLGAAPTGVATSGGRPAGMAGLNADFATRVAAMMAAIPGLRITSGMRTFAEQARLYRDKPGLAARPGTSNHEDHGAGATAADVAGPLDEAHARAAEFGLRFPMLTRGPGRKFEPWHVEPINRAGAVGGGEARGSLTAIQREQDRIAIQSRELGADSPLGRAELDADIQRKNIEALSAAAGRTTGEIAALAEKQRILNEYWRQGIELTPQMAAKLDEVTKKVAENAEAQERYQKSIEGADFVRDQSRSLFSGVGKAIGSGKNAGEAFREWGRNLGGSLIDKGGSMLTEGLFGKNGSPLGGLFGGAGLGAGQMNVTAGIVNVGGTGIGGLLGGAGGAGGNIFGDLLKTAGGGAAAPAAGGGIGSLFSFIPKLFGFADGGIMTSRGPLPLRRYSTGGIARSPQLALHGEGDVPEAYIPVPSGRVPVTISAPVGERRGAGQRPIMLNFRGGDTNVAGDVSEQNRELIAASQSAAVAEALTRVQRDLPTLGQNSQQWA